MYHERWSFRYCYNFALICSEVQRWANTQFEVLIFSSSSWWTCSNEAQSSEGVFLSLKWLQGSLVGQAVLGSALPLTCFTKKECEIRKALKCLSNISESWELGLTAANYREQGTEWSARLMCLLKVAVLPCSGRWVDISAACHCLQRTWTEPVFNSFGFFCSWKWVAALHPVMVPLTKIWSNVVCVYLPHNAVINVYFSHFSVHSRSNFFFPLPPRRSLCLSARTITFVNSAASTHFSVESAPRLLCFTLRKWNLNVFGGSGQHLGTLFLKKRREIAE